MTPGPPPSPETVRAVLSVVAQEVATALWLSAGMLCAIASLACNAFGWRKSSLLFGLLYSATLCFVHNGHAEILGPVGCVAALVGFVWPPRKNPP